MKRGTKLIALCAALVVAVGLYALVRTVTAEPEEEETAITLAQIGAGEVSALSWTWEGNTLTLEQGEEGWSLAGEGDFPLDQTQAENLMNTLYEVTASREIAQPEALEDYGLEEPVLSISVEGEESWSFALGDQNELTQEYYLLLNGDETKVYLVDTALYDAFALELMDLVELEELPDFGTATALTVDQPSGTLEVFYSQEGESLSYTGAYEWFLRQGEEVYPLDTESVTTLCDSITGLTWLSCVDYAVTEEGMEGYGLGENALMATLTYEGEEDKELFTLLVGSDCDEGTYATLLGSQQVYLIDTATADTLRYAAYSNLRPSQICAMEWESVEWMEITLNGETYPISFDGTEEVETTDADGESYTETVEHYSLNGEELDADQISALLGAISGLTATAQGGSEIPGEELISFTLYRDSETFSQLEWKVYAYDAASCLVTFQDQGGQLVDRSQINELVELAQELIS